MNKLGISGHFWDGHIINDVVKLLKHVTNDT